MLRGLRTAPTGPLLRSLAVAVFFGDEELANLDCARQLSVAYKTLVEQVFQYFQQNAGLRTIQQRQVFLLSGAE